MRHACPLQSVCERHRVTRNQQSSESLSQRVASLRGFSRIVAVSLVVLSVGVCAGLYALAATDLRESLRVQAATYSDLVLTTREWNARHEGVFVLKTTQSPTNPYLRDLGIEPDAETTDGVSLTMRNPAAMTREISELTDRKEGVRFRLVSLKPVNPDNSPDDWETRALVGFESSPQPASAVETSGGATYYRYMVPLRVERSCLRCHEKQGYRLGDLRGGLDVSIPYASTAAAMRRNVWLFGGLALAASVGLVTAFGTLFGRYQRRLEEAARQLRHVASVDELTQLANRRTAIERLEEEMARARRTGEPLSVVTLDIDYFKRVNDTGGHAAGDAVLREVAARLAATVREYDVTARMGGEEFLVVCPAADTEAGVALAARLLEATRHRRFSAGDKSFEITVSAGVTTLAANDDTDTLLARADEALYAAKAAGRDCVIAM